MKSSSRLGLSLVVVVLAVFVGLATPSASGQCFGPDLLDLGPCCAFVVPNLPVFPPAALPATGICWTDCTVSGQQDLRVSWTPPFEPFCGEFISQLTVDDAGGAPLLSGLLTMDYTRTWLEDDPNTGAPVQVWRFAAKVDLQAVAGGAISPCVVPSCIQPVGPHSTAFYYGYVDYMSCSAAGPWEQVIVLEHQCDRFIHTAGFSDRPGVFHPNTSYAIVAPHSTVQPFVPANSIAPGGPLIAEATRNVLSGPVFACVVEDRVAAGSLDVLGAGCLCLLTTSPNQHTLRRFSGTTSCLNAIGLPGGWTSLNILFPTLPWYHVVTTSIGSWTAPSVYPGVEVAWVDEGLFITQDACTGDFVEIKYGGTTTKGWNVIPTGGAVINSFLDMADNYSAPLAGPHPLPIFGTVHPTDHLVYVNTP